MTAELNNISLLTTIVDRVNVGVFVVDRNYNIVLWNDFMSNYSGRPNADVVDRNLFECFPELPQSWLEPKIRNVFLLRNFSFTSWENRPYLFQFKHNRPITGGIDHMRQNCTFIPVPGINEEIEFVCVTINDVTDTSIYETLLKDAVKSLGEASNRDGLTNCHNRRYFEQSLAKEFDRTNRYGSLLSLIIMDLDHFKKVNDNFGHLMGDQVLKQTASIVNDALRATDTLSRYGGEEFALVLPETNLAGALVLAERLRIKISSTPITYDGKTINITASLGVAERSPEITSCEQLIHCADTALYHSKQNRRNQVTAYDPNNEGQKEFAEQENELSTPIENDWITYVVIGYR